MNRNRILLAGLFIAGLVVGASALAFTAVSTAPKNPDRTLLVRDDLALAYSLALLEMDRKHWSRFGFDAPALKKGEKNTSPAYVERYLDELMATSYGMGNAFLRQKSAVQNAIVADIRSSGRLDGIRREGHTRLTADIVGKPHTFRDVDGSLVMSPFIPPTPTPTPNPGQ